MEHLSKRIENYWDERSKDFSRVRVMEFSGVDGKNWEKIFKSNLPNEKKLKVLDVGTGAGFFAAILAKMGHEVMGIDMSSKMLAEAEKNLRELKLSAKFIKMNAQKLKFADKTFDLIVTRNLTWTLPDVKAAYREWRRVLKVGGVLMNFDSDYGEKIFSDKVFTKTKITDFQLNECDEIKNSVEISQKRRPSWDAGFLEGLGFKVSVEEDISHFVHKDLRCDYDSVPLFAIYAVK